MITTDKNILELVSDEVPMNTDVSEFVDIMRREMLKSKGVGIAAIQVAMSSRIIIINTERCQMVVINPVLSDGKYPKQSKEGCLSVPNKRVKVERFNHITISGFDENWKPVKKKLKALSAFVAQHEVDHLNGITI
jgi:peptide deformylase